MARVSSILATIVLCASSAQAQVDSGAPHRIGLASQVHVLGDAGARAAFLDRTIAVDFDDVPLRAALATIAREAGLRFTYDEALVSRESHLSLHATSITVIDALSVALRGTAVDAHVWPNGDVTLRESGHGLARGSLAFQGTATITGHVTDGVLKTPLSSVSVRIDGTTLGTTADADGEGHGISSPANIRDEMQREIAWFDTFLSCGKPPAERACKASVRSP